MIYLSGAIRPEMAHQPDLGWMLTPMMGNAPDLSGTLWGADTGCFSQPDSFNAEAYLGWLDARKEWRDRCLFATAPDRVGDAAGTLEQSAALLPAIRRLGYRAALVAQDGLEDLPVPWDDFDVLFVGGTTRWKLSEDAYRLAYEAEQRGKWTHMGRVNSWRRLKAAAVTGYDSSGFDSCDGTYLKFGPDILLPRLMGWIETLRSQGTLEPWRATR